MFRVITNSVLENPACVLHVRTLGQKWEGVLVEFRRDIKREWAARETCIIAHLVISPVRETRSATFLINPTTMELSPRETFSLPRARAHDACPPGLFDRLQSSKTVKEGSCKETADRKSREKIAASRRETLQDDETKFAALVRSHREAEKRCKFEELQAASRKLERRLYEEDDHLRASKDRSAAR